MAVKAPSRTSRGYQVNFVEQPPKEIEVDCPVCFNVLFEPKLATCCGHSFCAACIGPIKSGGKPCPLCSQQIELVDDKRLERILNGLTVYCPHKEKGCEWTGELREVNNHLNKQPATDSLLKGCQYQEILCEVCQSHQCERQLMEDHILRNCPECEIKCEYHYVGCDFKGSQPELDGHMSKAMNVHLSLLAKFVQSSSSKKDNEIKQLKEELKHELTEMDNKIEQLKEELKQQKEINEIQKQQNTEVKQLCGQQAYESRRLKRRISQHWILLLCILLVVGSIDSYLYQALDFDLSLLNCGQDLSEERLDALCLKRIGIQIQQIRSEVQYLGDQIDFRILPLNVYLTHLSRRKDSISRWLSMPFYTHQGGYKMCLVVYLADNEISIFGTNILVAVHLMNGRYDDQLDRPPNLSLKVTLFKQSLDNCHQVIKQFTLSTFYPDDSVVIEDTVARNGIHTQTEKVELSIRHFWELDSLYFRVELEKRDDKRWYHFWS